jgi:hypothetical protein
MIPPKFFTAPLAAIDLEDVIKRAIDNNADLISDLVGKQLDQGLDGQGNDLGEYANFEYKGRWSPVDLKLTGDFRQSIVPGTYKDFFEMTASDPKTEDLTQRYGDPIIDLSDDSIEKVKEYIIDDMIEFTEAELVNN